MLIVHGMVITQGQENRIIEDGALYLAGARIADLGASQDLLARYPQEQCLDAEGLLVMPGLICAHTHAHQILARGLMPTPGLSIQEGISTDRWSRFEAALDYEDIRYAALLTSLEAIRSGTTTLCDQHSSPKAMRYALDAVAEATLQAGIRACLCYGVSEQRSATEARQGVQENARFARRTKEETLLAASMGLQALSVLSEETLIAAVGAAALVNIGFHVHLAEDLAEVRESVARFKARPVERLRKRGALGPRTMVVGCAHLSPEEAATLDRARAFAVHTPRASVPDMSRLGMAARMPLKDLAARLPVCLGSDGYPGDMLREMQATYLAHGHRAWGQHALGLEGVAVMALGNNAILASRLFGAPLGELRAGALADVILVDYPSPTPITVGNLTRHLILGWDGARVDTTIVGGRVLMRHGRLTTLDEEAVAARSRELARQLWRRL